MKKITGNKPTDLQHLLSIDEMDISLINDIFKSADKFLKNNQSIDKYKILQGKNCV
jgi:aspartate carbamoyltransferase catalytic subunit